MTLNASELLQKEMNEMAAQFKSIGFEVEIPPNSMKTHGAIYNDYEPGKMLSAVFPFNENFLNPLRTYQGGFLCAAIDDVFGPLTYLTAKRPVLTVQMNTTFIRPFTQKDEKITIRAEVISQSKSLLVLQAEVKTQDGKLIAISNNQSFIMP